jgi:flagellar hook protein FlgE
MASINGILSNGVSAMMAQSIAMSSVSDNIANISTLGFKRSDTLFSTLLGEQDAPNANALAPSNNQNGINATTRQLVDVDGSIHTTGNAFDLAISGPGMFTFADNPTNPTSFVFGRAGSLTPIVPTSVNGGAASTTTVATSSGAFLGNQNGQYLMAMPVTPPAPGQPFVPTTPTSTSQLVAVQISNQAPFPGQATTLGSLAAVIPAVGATTVSAPISYIDTAGVSQSMTVTWSNPVVTNVPPASPSTAWTVTVTDANNNVATTGTMTFDQLGNAVTPATLAVTATSTNVPPPATTAPSTSFNLDLSKVQMLGNATTTAGGQALAVNTSYTQDGLPAGAFEGVQINNDGTILGKYAGGATQILYQIPLARFPSVDNLQTLAGNVYAPTQASGSESFFMPGTGGPVLNIGAVEESNVDLGQSFTQMILTQQAYNSAAQVLHVADQMSQIAASLHN